MSDTAKRIAELEKELAESINGYISRKVIKGKERFYLQWTENGKLKSRYIKTGELEQTRALVERRKSLQAELKKLLEQLMVTRISQALRCSSVSNSRSFFMYRKNTS